MLTADELRTASRELRARTRRTDDDLVAEIEADVEAYRGFRQRQATQLPPDQLLELLPLMGWLIYESSWDAVQRVAASFDRDAGDQKSRRQSLTELVRVSKIAECARRLPWPEFAPRSIGAMRALALAESKRDTDPGYDSAWTLHDESRQRYWEYRDSHGSDPARQPYVLSLDETFLQLALAETGTACRTAERVIARWAEEFEGRGNQRDWLQRIFRELTAGVAVGERAIETGLRIQRDFGFVDKVDEFRLTRHSALQNPGIMTARAVSLLLAIRPAMQDLGRLHPPEFDSWELWEQGMQQKFSRAYEVIEADVVDSDDVVVPMDTGFQRQLVHVRLNMALVKPGFDLPSSRGAILPCTNLNPLDGAAAAAMSGWLAGPDGRGRERGLGAATMPLFIRSLIGCRGLGLHDRGYQDWRLTWFQLDHWADEEGRRQRVEAALAQAIAD